jgi:hypothetical protein
MPQCISWRGRSNTLTDAERADLVQVVEGYTSPHDHDAARRGIEWMREHYRRLGQTVRSDPRGQGTATARP